MHEEPRGSWDRTPEDLMGSRCPSGESNPNSLPTRAAHGPGVNPGPMGTIRMTRNHGRFLSSIPQWNRHLRWLPPPLCTLPGQP